jgi:hypothetical protein
MIASETQGCQHSEQVLQSLRQCGTANVCVWKHLPSLRAGSKSTGLCTHNEPSFSLTTAIRPPTSIVFHMKGLSAPHTTSFLTGVRVRPRGLLQVLGSTSLALTIAAKPAQHWIPATNSSTSSIAAMHQDRSFYRSKPTVETEPAFFCAHHLIMCCTYCRLQYSSNV